MAGDATLENTDAGGLIAFGLLMGASLANPRPRTRSAIEPSNRHPRRRSLLPFRRPSRPLSPLVPARRPPDARPPSESSPAGALHVLMGADHLCALAVVASPGASDVDARSASARAESSLRHAARSFILGVRWSVGHGAGLAVVCAVFFATKRRLDLERLSVVADKLVGASMIALGAVSLFSLHRWRRRRAAERRHVADAHADGPDARDIHSPGVAPRLPEISLKTSETDEIASPSRSVRGVALELEAGSDAHAMAHHLDVPHTHAPADVACGKMSTSSPVGVRTEDVAAVVAEASRAVSPSASGSCTASRGRAVYSPCSPRSCSRTRRDRWRTSWRFSSRPPRAWCPSPPRSGRRRIRRPEPDLATARGTQTRRRASRWPYTSSRGARRSP